MSFREYWKLNKAMYTQLGVTEGAAYKIWCDAVDQVEKGIIKYALNI